MKFSWQNLKKPFFVLAPMEGATDTVFRQIVLSCAKPDAVFTEFTNVEGLLSKGGESVGRRLLFEQNEKPIIAQIWGLNPDAYEAVAKKCTEMGFDGIDINMGCPEKTVVRHGCCSALIENPEHAAKIINAVKKGAPGLPISVKTRIGFKTIQTEKWISFLLQQNLDAITVHFRTQKEMSLVPPHWEEAEKVSKLRDKISPNTVIIGNGDVLTVEQGKKLTKKYGLNGIMIGRGVFKNPYVFDPKINYESQTVAQRIDLLKKHLDLFEKTWTKAHKLDEKEYGKAFPPLKRFFKIYISGFNGASEMREKLMASQNLEATYKVLEALNF